jgi:GNAT superfamily N-acetyltransferase
MRIRRADPGDVPLISRWRQEAARWLATKGTDQWSNAGITSREFEKRVHQSISEGGTWIIESDSRVPLATIAVDDHEDDVGLWDTELLHDSFVIHRMIVSRQASGQGIGALLLDHADGLARSAGKNWLILDAWATNSGLHDYYRSQGFRYIKTVVGHSTPSAALFVRPVSYGGAGHT